MDTPIKNNEPIDQKNKVEGDAVFLFRDEESSHWNFMYVPHGPAYGSTE